jgi:tripartite-type tricarboxylate transporter receptor subunit TctC
MRSTMTKRIVLSVALAAVAAFGSTAAFAQTDPAANFPNKPIRLIVGFAAGGGNDLIARIVGPKLSENIGQPVIVENKTGAGGRLAIEYAQSQPADGYTVVIGAIGQLAVSSAIYPNLPFHPTKTLMPLSMLASYPLVITGQMNDRIKSVQELVAWGKANPDKTNYPTSSPIFTIASELFKMKTGMPAQAVPYRSTNEMLLSVVGGQTTFAIGDSASAVALVKSGKLRGLAVANPTRISELPDVPTVAEVGLADLDLKSQWGGAFVIAGTPPAIAKKLETEFRRALTDPGVREKIRAISYYPEGGSAEEYRQRIDADIKLFSDVVKAANLKFEQ